MQSQDLLSKQENDSVLDELRKTDVERFKAN